MVRITGVEPAPSCPDWHLKPARLPIPPYPHYKSIISQVEVFVKHFFSNIRIFLSKGLVGGAIITDLPGKSVTFRRSCRRIEMKYIDNSLKICYNSTKATVLIR